MSVKVYVVERGCYAESYVVGVYATLEAAKRGLPQSATDEPSGGRGSAVRAGGWKESAPGEWSNGLDWDDACHITEYEVGS